MICCSCNVGESCQVCGKHPNVVEQPIDWSVEGPKWKELALWLETKYYHRTEQALMFKEMLHAR